MPTNPGPAKKPAHQLINVRQYIDTKEQNVKQDENRTQFHEMSITKRPALIVSDGLALPERKPDVELITSVTFCR
jgi:hypothetical protein